MFTHRLHSGYDDRLEYQYHFPATYRPTAERTVGDWIVFYEPRRSRGRQAYVGAARVVGIEPDPTREDHYYAHLEAFVEFAAPVPYRDDKGFLESKLEKPDGSASKGAFGRSVRAIPDA
ncbi:MAG: restriction endonuclease, partial [Pseudomonadota bacterium]